MRRFIVGLAATALMVTGARQVSAEPAQWGVPVQWKVEDAGNGHYYEWREVPHLSVTWPEAFALAEASTFLGIQGHLATVTSEPETEFLRATLPLPPTDPAIEFWLGGYQDLFAPDSEEPAGGWRWVTGEDWSYANWWAGEPNNAGGMENFLQTAGGSRGLLRWNDATEIGSRGYIVEYVPEPSTLALLSIGALAVLAYAWRRRRAA